MRAKVLAADDDGRSVYIGPTGDKIKLLWVKSTVKHSGGKNEI